MSQIAALAAVKRDLQLEPSNKNYCPYSWRLNSCSVLNKTFMEAKYSERCWCREVVSLREGGGEFGSSIGGRNSKDPPRKGQPPKRTLF